MAKQLTPEVTAMLTQLVGNPEPGETLWDIVCEVNFSSIDEAQHKKLMFVAQDVAANIAFTNYAPGVAELRALAYYVVQTELAE